MSTVAEVLVDQLAAAGVETIFGLPGGEVVEILDAIRQQGLRFVLVHNEASALFMADATARLTGKPGVALTTLGPGATNAVSGVAHAYLDRSPVIVITAQKPDHLLPDYTHQVLDLHALYRPITKGSFKVTGANVQTLVPQALALAQAGRPGPVHLQVSNEAANETAVEHKSDANASLLSATDPAAALTRFRVAITQARQLLAQARRPLILAGLGLEPEGPYTWLHEFSTAANAPVIVTPKAKGALADDRPLAAGVIGLTRTDPVYSLLDETDCIVALGFDVVELVKPWQHPAPLIWVAPWANTDPVVPAAVELVGPLSEILQQLTDSDFATAPEWGASRVASFRAQQARHPLPVAVSGRVLPQQLLDALREALPRTTLMAVDVGSHKIFSSLEWPTYTPNRFLLSNGLSSMGFALPSAIGASLALGEPTVCLTGDAGMAMVLGELGVLAELQAPVIVVVLNDSAIDLIRSHQVRAGKPVYGTEFRSPNFSQIAAAYDINAQRIEHVDACTPAIEAALASGGPALLEVMLDPSSYPTTPASHR
ncbi:MAG: thiamine pyrophosphate-binding protein [Caldilineaceae bacterium]